MPQLIGLPCALCDERINTVLEGTFCAACGSAVHLKCARPRQRGPTSCEACGATAEMAAVHQRHAHEEEASFRRTFKTHRLAWGVVEVTAGVLGVAVGLVLGSWTLLIIIVPSATLAIHGLRLLVRTKPRAPKDT